MSEETKRVHVDDGQVDDAVERIRDATDEWYRKDRPVVRYVSDYKPPKPIKTMNGDEKREHNKANDERSRRKFESERSEIVPTPLYDSEFLDDIESMIKNGGFDIDAAGYEEVVCKLPIVLAQRTGPLDSVSANRFAVIAERLDGIFKMRTKQLDYDKDKRSGVIASVYALAWIGSFFYWYGIYKKNWDKR